MRRALRTEKISIDLPRPEVPAWIHATLQHVEFDDDGQVISVSARAEEIFRKADQVATQVVKFHDPILDTTTLMSVAGMAQAIRQMMFVWIEEDFPDTHHDAQINRMVFDGAS